MASQLLFRASCRPTRLTDRRQGYELDNSPGRGCTSVSSSVLSSSTLFFSSAFNGRQRLRYSCHPITLEHLATELLEGSFSRQTMSFGVPRMRSPKIKKFDSPDPLSHSQNDFFDQTHETRLSLDICRVQPPPLPRSPIPLPTRFSQVRLIPGCK